MMHQMMRTAILACLLVAAGAPGHAATCQVPSEGHQTIQSAIDDPSCSEIALAAGTLEESPIIARDLILTGAGSTQTIIDGHVEVSGGTVALRDLQISSPPGASTEALVAHSGAQVSGMNLVVVNGRQGLLFGDGFEGGDTRAWSGTVP